MNQIFKYIAALKLSCDTQSSCCMAAPVQLQQFCMVLTNLWQTIPFLTVLSAQLQQLYNLRLQVHS